MSDDRDEAIWQRWHNEFGNGAGSGPMAIPWAPRNARELEQMMAPFAEPVEMRGQLFACNADLMDDRPMSDEAIIRHGVADPDALVQVDHAHPHRLNVVSRGKFFAVSRSTLAEHPGETYRMIQREAGSDAALGSRSQRAAGFLNRRSHE